MMQTSGKATMENLTTEGNVSVRRNRVESYSYIRACACFAIVVLHTVHASILTYGETLSRTQYLVSRAIENCMMWAVPCFLMVTGALLLNKNKEITYAKLFRKYILRIFIALAVFCMILRLTDAVLEGETFSIYLILDGMRKLFTGSSWAYLWYLYLLIGLYFFLPFYKKIVQNSTENELKYLAGLYIVFLSLIPILQIWDVKCGFYITTASIYPLFLFLGYMLHEKMIYFGKAQSALLAIGATGIIILATVIRWEHNISAMDILLGYASIFVIIQSMGIFLLLDQIGRKKFEFIRMAFVKIDECSFGIYLFHMIFIKILLTYVKVNPYEMGGSIMAGIIILVFAVSYLVVKVLKRWKVFRKIL